MLYLTFSFWPVYGFLFLFTLVDLRADFLFVSFLFKPADCPGERERARKREREGEGGREGGVARSITCVLQACLCVLAGQRAA